MTGRQLWRCTKCGRLRQWGLGAPPVDAQGIEAFLHCVDCKQPRPHTYRRIAGDELADGERQSSTV